MPKKLDKDTATERVQIVASAAWIQRVEEWRRAQPRIPSMSAAIRDLVDLALAEPSRPRKTAQPSNRIGRKGA